MKNIFIILMSFATLHGSDYTDLDKLALESGTDKSSAFHNYTEVYSRYFAKHKDESLKFLEIGVFKGSSVQMWEAYFSQAELHFIDIDFSRLTYQTERAHYHQVDQKNVSDLRKFASESGPFSIIIDDGGHTMAQQINSFKALFPFVESGGMYIIEDLHTSYWKSYGGGGSPKNPIASPNSCITFLTKRIHDLNYCGAATRCANFNPLQAELNEYQANIASMHFYPSLCIIFKR